MNALFSRVSLFNAALAAAIIVSMTLLICLDIASRNLFSIPIRGVSDYVSYSIVVCVYLQLGLTVRNDRLVKATFFVEKFNSSHKGAMSVMQTVFSLAAFIIMFLAVQYLWNDFINSWLNNEYLGSAATFRLPTWPFKFFVSIASTIVLFELIIEVLTKLKNAKFKKQISKIYVLVIAIGILLVSFWAFDALAAAGHDRIAIGVSALFLLLVLVGLGMPMAFALLITSFLGIWLIRDNLTVAINSIGISASAAVRSSGFGVIPLFVLMGLLLDKAGVGRDAFQIMGIIVKRLSGGLGVATVGANAIFASITGSSIASATVFSRIAIPPMVEAGYTKKFSMGIVAGSSVLGMLIPPSLLMIIYGLLAEVSIGKMFIAGIIPGFLLALSFSILIIGLVQFRPLYAGTSQNKLGFDDLSFSDMVHGLGPVIFVVTVVMGGIYGGIFSPTEAGAAGAFGALLVALARRSLSWIELKQLILETGAITSGLLFLMIAASVYGRMLSMSTIPMQAANLISALNLSLIVFVILYVIIVIILGMILDSVSILLIMLPIALPIISLLGGDPIWFGIITVIAVEIGLLTPPFGLSVYVVKASLPDNFASLGEIFAAAAPFVFVMLIVTLLLIFFPWLTTVLL